MVGVEKHYSLAFFCVENKNGLKLLSIVFWNLMRIGFIISRPSPQGRLATTSRNQQQWRRGQGNFKSTLETYS